MSVVEQREETGIEGEPGPGPGNDLIYDLEAHPAVSTRPLPKEETHAVLQKQQRSPYLTTSTTPVTFAPAITTPAITTCTTAPTIVLSSLSDLPDLPASTYTEYNAIADYYDDYLIEDTASTPMSKPPVLLHPQTDDTMSQGPRIDDTARLAELLPDAGIRSALWGVNAAGCYGGGLCPLDIEIVINEADQARTYELLCSYGCRPSQPLSDESAPCLDDFEKCCGLALHYKYYDRRRLRICTPIYELPKSGDSFNHSFHPFIIVYTAERVGLPAVPPLSKIEAYTDSKNRISSHNLKGSKPPRGKTPL